MSAHELSPAALAEVVDVAQTVLGTVGFGAERAGGSLADAVEDLFVVERHYSENALFEGFGVVSMGELVGQPAVKFLIRNTDYSAPELYDLATDRAESRDVAAANPEVVKRLQAAAESARADLGDSLTNRVGPGVREPGRVPAEK